MSSLWSRLLTIGALVLGASVVAVNVGEAAHAVPGISFHTTTSGFEPRVGKTQTAWCPAGKRILGGGGYVGNGAGEVLIDSLRPVSTAKGDFFEAIASVPTRADGTGYGGSWFLLAYAICGNAPAGLQYVSASSASDFSASRSVTVSCPSGKQVIGLGGQVAPAFGFVALDELAPSAFLTSVRVTAYQMETPSPLPWRVNAFAVCADPLPGLVRVTASTPANSSDKSINVLCPAGTKVHSVGADMVGGVGQTSISALFPSQPLDHASLRVQEDHTGLSSTWSANLYAICAA